MQSEEQKVELGLRILRQVVARLVVEIDSHVQFDDLLSIGHFALVGLVGKHDSNKSPFDAYVRTRLRWAILDGIRADTHHRTLVARAQALSSTRFLSHGRRLERLAAAKEGREPPTSGQAQEKLQAYLRSFGHALGLPLTVSQRATGLTADSRSNPHDNVTRKHAAEELRHAVDQLEHAAHRELVIRYYFQNESLEEVAENMGMSKGWASRLHAQALKRLQFLLEGTTADPVVPNS